MFPATFDEFIDEVNKREPLGAIKQHFRAALDTADRDPVTLYLFFFFYNHLNAQIASIISGLVTSLGASRDLYIDPSIPNRASADLSFRLAEEVQRASTNEYGDPDFRDQDGQPISHRVLAAGLLQAIGDYAGLTDEQRNLFETPEWLTKLALNIQKLYSGEIGNLRKNAKGAGAHAASEMSADYVEFCTAMRKFFIEQKNQGFHEWLQINPLITVQGQTFPAHWWLETHGGEDENTGEIIHAAEHDHLQAAFRAASLMTQKLPPKQSRIAEREIFKGFSKCLQMLDTFFIGAREECERFNPKEFLNEATP